MTALVHLASRLYGTPLLIARAKLDTILAVLGPRIGLAPTELALPVVVPAAAEAEPGPTAPGIAVIPIHGTLVRRAIGLDAASGLTSYTRIAADLDAALAAPEVAGILLDIDSPGGEAGGVFELAARIREATERKPVWAHAGDSAFSAGYALACAAQRVTLSTTGGVGSIGVIALHIDQSVRNAQNGLSVTALYAGAHKNDATPHAPLTPQATDALQTEIDRLYALFVAHVAAMRGLDANAVRATEAALFFGEDARVAGLADGVASLDAALADFATALARGPSLGRHLPGSPTPLASPAHLALPPPMETSMTVPTEAAPVQPTPPAAPAPAAVVPTVAPAALPAPTASVAPPSTDPQAEAVAIAELCLLAGCPERTTEFLAARMSAAQARQVLLQARADQVEIASHHLANAAPAATTTNPVLDAVRRRIALTTPQGA
ncbi:MAG: S49 family peptidase [Pseudomonadota bacterium]